MEEMDETEEDRDEVARARRLGGGAACRKCVSARRSVRRASPGRGKKRGRTLWVMKLARVILDERPPPFVRDLTAARVGPAPEERAVLGVPLGRLELVLCPCTLRRRGQGGRVETRGRAHLLHVGHAEY